MFGFSVVLVFAFDLFFFSGVVWDCVKLFSIVLGRYILLSLFQVA